MYQLQLILSLSTFAAVAFGSDVIVFTKENFDTRIKEHDIMLVEFYAPWCGHCKKLAPEYETAATTLRKSDPSVPLAKVDCTAEQDVCSRFGVSGYPTLKIFRGGEFSEEYTGPRDSDGIVKFMKSRAGPSSRELSEVDDAEKFIKSSEHSIVGFFSNPASDLAKTFQKVADALSSDLRFAHTSEQSIRDKFEYDDAIVVFQPKRLHSKFEDAKQKYDGKETQGKIKTWLQEAVLGLCAHRTIGNADKFKKPLFVAFYDVDYTKNEKGTNYWRNRVMKVGKKLNEAGKKAFFAISDKTEFSQELGEFGVDKTSGDKPIVTALDEKDRKFKMSEEFSMDNFEKFINDVLDNKLEPYLKSEEVPEPNDDAVKVAVAKNFDELVNDESKDVLIEFYAPWCGHCKQLEPKYKELAEKLQKTETDIVIAKMDATANDVPKPYEVSGFPTLYFAPKNSKSSPKKYNGGREVNDFIKYLAKEATDELNGFTRDGKKKKKAKKTEL